MNPMTAEGRELDVLWRQTFKQPLPMLGAPEVARAILDRHIQTKVEGKEMTTRQPPRA